MVGSPERTQQLYGRVLPIHLERAGHRADAGWSTDGDARRLPSTDLPTIARGLVSSEQIRSSVRVVGELGGC